MNRFVPGETVSLVVRQVQNESVNRVYWLANNGPKINSGMGRFNG